MADTIDLGIEGLGPATYVARGGSAFVYLAEQLDFARQVAVKILFEVLEDDATYKRFDRECRAIGAVSHHPNIVVVHGRGLTADDRPYLIMEHRAGGSLADRLAVRGRFPETEAIQIGIKIGRALQVAHDAGVLHRDVKPGNILLSVYNEPALADFGIARMEGGHKTTEGHFSASVVHASREILDSGEPTPRSDVYALASTLYELVTGAPAYSRSDDQSMWAVIHRVLNEDVPDPTGLGVSRGLASVLLKGMSHDFSTRHGTAAQFVAELEALTQGGGISADTQPVPFHGWDPDGDTPAAEQPGAGGMVAWPPADLAGSGEPVTGTARSGPTASSGAASPPGIGPSAGIAASPGIASSPGPTASSGIAGSSGTTGSSSTPSSLGTPSSGDPAAAGASAAKPKRGRVGVLAVVAVITVASVAAAGLVIRASRSADDGDGTTESADGNEGQASSDESLGSDVLSGEADGDSLTAVANPTLDLVFARAEIGPLEVGGRYVLGLQQPPDGARYRIVVDGAADTDYQNTIPVFFPTPGRHSVQLEVVTDDRAELTEAVEVYVADQPEPGFRANLSAVRSRPENWPEALRQFDRMVADGHAELKLSISTRQDDGPFPYWNYYVDGFGDDRTVAQEYCDGFGLGQEQCFVAQP